MAKEKSPRISVNKLAEFMMAKGARQRQILKDQKFPTDFKGMYYKEASESVAHSLASNLENLTILTNSIGILDQTTTDKVGTQRRVAANIDAIETFLEMADKVDLKGGSPKLGANSASLLTIYGVEISVRPEIVLTGVGKSKVPLVGGVKLHFSRTFALTPDSAGYVSAISQEWCKQHLDNEGTAYGPYCSVIDVGSKTMHDGVKATLARMKDVEAVCQNIAALWPTITP